MAKFSPPPFTCEDLVWREFDDLRFFVQCCDRTGLKVPNDSLKLCNLESSKEDFRRFHEDPSIWPADEFLENNGLWEAVWVAYEVVGLVY